MYTLKYLVGLLLAVATLMGFIFTLKSIGTGGPLVLLPYGVVLIGTAAFLLLYDWVVDGHLH